jgi:signal transduction histidine kinase
MSGRGRAVLIYILAVILPTAVLLYFSFRSIQRQRDAIAVLQKANYDLSTERRNSQLNLEKSRLAEACLCDLHPDLIPIAIPKLRAIHPIAKHFFSWRDGRLLFPAMDAEPSAPVKNPLLCEGERLELQENSLERAISHYRWARAQDLSAGEQALSLAREARCLRKLGQRAEAEAAWRRLANDYPDVRDPYNRPYALVAAWEANSDASLIERACRQFVSGRWLLSVDHVEYYKSRFQQASPTCLPAAGSDFLDLVQFAKALNRANPQLAGLDTSGGHHFTLAGDRRAYEIWYDTREPVPGHKFIVGFAADTDWLDKRLNSMLPTYTPVQPPLEGSWTFWWLTFGVAVTMLGGLFLVSRAAWRESQLNRGRAEFLAGISHDMKTPLAVIQQHTEELIEDVSLDELERRANHHIILRQQQKLLAAINNALTVARQNSSPSRFKLESVDPAPLLEHVTESFRKTLHGDAVSLVTQFDADLPKVAIHAESMSRAIWNILDNARKYTPPPTTIRVRARTRGGWLAIEIEDSGIGIPMWRRRGIFEPYHRLRNGLQKPGMGLGLTVVKQLIEEHHGKIEVRRVRPTGTLFRLLLPIGGRASVHEGFSPAGQEWKPS